MRKDILMALLTLALACGPAAAQQSSPQAAERPKNPFLDIIPPHPATMPLYPGEIPNSISTPDEEETATMEGLGTWIQKVSRPMLISYLPAKVKACGSAIIIFPGGGYMGESYQYEGTSIAEALRDRGIAAFIVKYRLPSDATMKDKSIGPLQDAEQAIKTVREHAAEWQIDPGKIGIIGFSAGGHLASTLGTHFEKNYLAEESAVNLRPDFMILVYPVISMTDQLTHKGSRDALLGKNPTAEQIQLFSSELNVTERTPPTLLIHATDDGLVDVDNSVLFYEALRHHHVSAQMVLFRQGQHGLFLIPRQDWLDEVFKWLEENGWMRP
jgi:acetyl esterase/lipase